VTRLRLERVRGRIRWLPSFQLRTEALFVLGLALGFVLVIWRIL
jgi:hypothetical protein